MKKIVAGLIMLVVATGPLFKGLFFPYEMYLALSVVTFLFAVYTGIKILKKEKFHLADKSVYMAGALVLSYVMAFTGAVSIRGNIEAVMQVFVYFLIFLVIYDLFISEKSGPAAYLLTAGFVSAAAVAGLLTAVMGLAGYTYVFPALDNTMYGERLGSTLQYANTAAIYFLILFILVVSLIINSKFLVLKAFWAGVGSVLAMALFFTGSRGVFLVVPAAALVILVAVMPKGHRLQSLAYALCVLLPIFFTMRGFDANAEISNIVSASKWVMLSAGISAVLAYLAGTLFKLVKLKVNRSARYRYWSWGIASGVSAVVLIVLVIKWEAVVSGFSAFVAGNIPEDVMARIQDINLHTRNVTLRFELFKDALKLIKNNWLFGLGGKGFTSLYQSVQDEYYAAKLVHNHYLQVFTDAGVIGFLAFTGIVVLTCVYFFRARMRLGDNKHRVFAAGMFSAFSALAVHSAIDFNLSYAAMSFLFYAFAGLAAGYHFRAVNPGGSAGEEAGESPGGIVGEEAGGKAGKIAGENAGGNSGEEAGENAGESPGGNTGAIIKAGAKNIGIPGIKELALPVSLMVICIGTGIAGLFFSGARVHADRGKAYKESIKPKEAIASYLAAIRRDPLEPLYHAELADTYLWMAHVSDKKEEKAEWLDKAVKAGERAVSLDSCYPYYNRILTMAYFDAREFIKACGQAQRLVEMQPLVNGNYEMLARGYLESAFEYVRNEDYQKAKEHFELCASIDRDHAVEVNSTIAFYQGKALLVLGEFDRAEELLKIAREGPAAQMMECDRLLYIINEETGREDENKKYRGVPWMAVVKLTPVYKEIKAILDKGLLK